MTEEPFIAREPLNEQQREGVLGAVVAALGASSDAALVSLGAALREGQLNATWWEEERGTVAVNLAVPPSHPLDNAGELEDKVFDLVSRAVGTCGLDLYRVRLTLALAKMGWRAPSKQELPLRLGGRYEREADPLKKGGFGAVYKALDVGTGETVAVKVLQFPGDAVPKEREQYCLRFQREMKLMSRLSHPNLIRVLWFAQEQSGLLWYAMPLAQGSLADRLDEFPADPNRVLSVLTSICEGVEYLHAHGVVHRDLSPGNVLCFPDGTWVISDLGLAFDLDRQFTQLTATGMLMGTPGYRPPEVEAKMAQDATAAWDIYSLGQLLADMAAGQSFKDRKGAFPVSVFAPAITRACSTEAARRFGSVREFLRECTRLVELTTIWEGPDERRTRIGDALRSGDPSAVHELAVAVGGGESVAPFSSALCDMAPQAIAALASSAMADLRELVRAFIKELPEQFTPFSQLDSMARFVISAAEALGDDEVSEGALVWALEVGWGFNRWAVQGQAEDYLRRLATASPEVVARALERTRPEALPEDLTWLHPAARPKPAEAVAPDPWDEEPF